VPDTIRTRHFVSLIPDPPRTAIRSVTHLVLAPSAFFSFSKSFPVFVFSDLGRAQPALASPENFQFRSVFIQF
jgi:hypothetical protein